MGTWRTLHPRRILHTPGAISEHNSFRQASLEPGPANRSAAEDSADWITASPKTKERKFKKNLVNNTPKKRSGYHVTCIITKEVLKLE